MKSHENMTRLDFLKHSGFIAAGFTFLPHSVLAKVDQSQRSDEVSVSKLAEYAIVVPDQANPVEQQAAEKLQHYLAEVSRKNVALKREADYSGGPAFFIGQTQDAKTRNIPFEQLKEDGFVYHPVGEKLIIAGGTGKGVLYGIYGLLELWGFRMYTSSTIEIPASGSISLPKQELVVVPAVHYRTTSYRDTRDAEYTDWH